MSMEDPSICTIAMATPESFIKKLTNLKVLLSLTVTINGLPQSLINGFPKKMRKWKSILRKNLEEEKLILKNSSFKTIEKSWNFMHPSKEVLSLFTTSWLMTLLKSEKLLFPILEKIHSQSPSKDKNFPGSSLWINLVRHTPKTLWKPSRLPLVVVLKYSVGPIILKDAINSLEITIKLSLVWDSLRTKTVQLTEKSQDQVLLLLLRHNYSSS